MSDQTPDTPSLGLGPGPVSPLMAAVLNWDPSASDDPFAAPDGAKDGDDAAAGGQPAPAAEGTPAEGGDAAAPAAGDGSEPAVPAEPAAADPGSDGQPAGEGTPQSPAVEGVDPAQYVSKFDEAATKIEENTRTRMQEQAMESMRTEYPKYFDLLRMHPRQLVGKRVPAASPDEPGQDAEGFITLKDGADAADWVEATKQLLSEEATNRANKLMEEEAPQMQVLHRTIDMFRNNPDIIPRTKGYNPALVEEFIRTAKPYEQRDEKGALLGYTIDVEPMLKGIRTRLESEAKPPAPAPAPAPAATPPAPPRQPQAGIQSKAGTSAETDDWGTFWKTMGVKPPMDI